MDEESLNGLTIFHVVFPDIHMFECGEYPGILHAILSIPHNIVMNLNHVMFTNNIPEN